MMDFQKSVVNNVTYIRIYFLCAAEGRLVTLRGDHDVFTWASPVADPEKRIMEDVKKVLQEARQYL